MPDCRFANRSRRRGAAQSFASHRHLRRLWSMDKVQSSEELLAWVARCEKLHAQLSQDAPMPPLAYAVEYKLDGLTVNLTYQGGSSCRLPHAATVK